jgi:hypothetical protein
MGAANACAAIHKVLVSVQMTDVVRSHLASYNSLTKDRGNYAQN